MQTENSINRGSAPSSFAIAGLRGCSQPREYDQQILFPKQMAPAHLVDLTDALFPLYLKGFMQEAHSKEAHAEMKQDLHSHLGQAERLMTLRNYEIHIGMVVSRTFEFDKKTVYHLQGIIISPEFHGKGLALRLLQDELQQTGANIVAFHTQSRRMLGLAKKVATMDEELARKLAGAMGTRHQDGVVDRQRYGGHSLYGDPARFASVAIPGIDCNTGSALICAGYVGSRKVGGL